MNARKRRLEEVMQTEVATLTPDERLDLADDVMQLGRVRHLPVLEGQRLVGIVSNRDLLAASLSTALDFESGQRRTFLRSIDVGEVMTPNPSTLPPSATVGDAADLIVARKFGCVPIVDGDVFLGLVTETDLLRAALASADPEASAAAREEETVTATRPERFEKELEELRRLRDELRVQVHLGVADAKDLWDGLEHRMGELEAKVRRLAHRAEEPLEEIGDAAQLLMEEIRDGYRRLRKLL